MSTLTEHEHEARPGLPEALPDGERIVWQGVPEWKTIALRTFHVRKVALYFVALLIFKLGVMIPAGESLPHIVASVSLLAFLAVIATGLLTLFAWMMGRTSLYTITNERIVMRVGVTMPMTINLPFKELQDGKLKLYKDGTGDIELTLVAGQRVSYVILWPHCNLLHPFSSLPTLRGVPNAEHVAGRFARAIADSANDVDNNLVQPSAQDFGAMAPAGQ
ncbi:MAG: photosynthetic complex putative assembly protein PuhB [Gammaproteobacteria bacterium]